MLNAPDQSYLVKLIDNYDGAISFTGSLLVLQYDCTGIDCFISIIPVHDKSTMGGRTQGSKDTKPRKRSKKTDFQKKKDAENRAKKKAQQESISARHCLLADKEQAQRLTPLFLQFPTHCLMLLKFKVFRTGLNNSTQEKSQHNLMQRMMRAKKKTQTTQKISTSLLIVS
jgi:hypothetical protein